MSKETEAPEKLSAVSPQVRFLWTLGVLSGLIGLPKKQIRKAFRILKSAKTTAELFKKGKTVKATFYYGFRIFSLRKKNKEREILQPHPEVQKVYRAVKDWLDSKFSAHDNAYGFVRERNSKKAIQRLLGKKHFFAFDIAQAFPSIKEEYVEKTLARLGIDESVAKSLAWFLTYYYHGQRRLPQGASASPILLNLVYRPMCEEIDVVCRKNNIFWAVYADDFNFAGEIIVSEVKQELLSIPAKFGFSIKSEKTKDNLGKTIPHALGLTVVNDKIHICRRKKKEYRRIMYAAIRYGTYSRGEVLGRVNAIRCIYGNENNWPKWLLQPWLEYQAKETR